jgi:hypothetical protein
LRRTINGELHDLSLPQFRKYRSTISCTDKSIPAIDGVFPGTEVTVRSEPSNAAQWSLTLEEV